MSNLTTPKYELVRTVAEYGIYTDGTGYVVRNSAGEYLDDKYHTIEAATAYVDSL